MTLNEIIKKIDQLKKEVDGLRPMNAEQEKRLLQKIRLDWNFHSSHIEGNTLTYGETKALLLWGTTAQGKPLRDHLEIKGHNEAVEYILEIFKGKDIDITQHFIREFHKVIIPEPYYLDAKTTDGLATKRKITPGEYKTMPNHVETSTGEMFYFATPEETPAKMNDLMDWYKNEIANNNTHPLIIASMFHYNFVRIHPFDDGNGRMSRILMNIVLMKYGFPPVVIDTKLKEDYLNALQYADADDFDKFTQFIGERLIDSLNLWLRAAKGETIEDESDIDKMTALLKKKIDGIVEPMKINFSIFKEVFESSFKPLLISTFNCLEKFDEFFKKIGVNLKINNKRYSLNPSEGEPNLKNTNNDFLVEILDKSYDSIEAGNIINTMEISYFYKDFYKELKRSFQIKLIFNIQFTDYYCMITVNPINKIKMKFNYSVGLEESERSNFVMEIATFLTQSIEKTAKEMNSYLKELGLNE